MQEKNHDGFFDEKQEQDPQENLMDMLDDFDKQTPVQFEKGARVTGKIVRIAPEYAFVDIGAKNEASIKVSELKDKEGTLRTAEGEEIEAYIIAMSDDEIVLSKSLAGYNASTSELVEAMKKKIPVSGKVTGVGQAGLHVKVMGKRAFCPISQVEIKYVDNVNVYFNQTMQFMVRQVSERGRNIVLTRIPLLEQELDKELDALSAAAGTDKVFTGPITRITNFGLFVDLGVAEGLVHISQVSWDRSENLNETFNVGDKVEAIVLGVEKKKRLRDTKISLSIKQVQADPWTLVEQKFQPGEQVSGVVTRLADFGAFVKIAEGIEGLIHVSEMSWTQKVRHPKDVLETGQQIKVTVLSVDANKREVGLSLKDVESDPWRDINERFPVGSSVTGKVAGQAKYGYFVDLTEGVTGLLLNQKISSEKKTDVKVGEELEVNIDSIDLANRRIALSCGIIERKRNEAEVKAYLNEQKVESSTSSEFGEALLNAISKKKD
ncbi:MAG: S1 RNA-binding domain-containing protein [Chitinivibrionales bacterium]|nr:S1 RNA-binding domain-containing protein [Chitinivibrionales bacterium]